MTLDQSGANNAPFDWFRQDRHDLAGPARPVNEAPTTADKGGVDTGPDFHVIEPDNDDNTPETYTEAPTDLPEEVSAVPAVETPTNDDLATQTSPVSPSWLGHDTFSSVDMPAAPPPMAELPTPAEAEIANVAPSKEQAEPSQPFDLEGSGIAIQEYVSILVEKLHKERERAIAEVNGQYDSKIREAEALQGIIAEEVLPRIDAISNTAAPVETKEAA